VAGLAILLIVGTVIAAVVLGRSAQPVRGVHDEMAQVTWPSPSLAVRYGRIVFLFLVAVTGFVVLLDVGFSDLISFIS